MWFLAIDDFLWKNEGNLCNIVQSHTLYTHCTPCIMTNGFVYFLMFEEKKNDDGVCDNPEESQ